MIEHKLDALIAAVERLADVIEAQHTPAPKPQPKPKSKPKPTPTPTLVKDPEPEPEQVETSESSVDRQTVKDLCMKIARADRTKTKQVKEIILETGAKTVDNVPSDQLDAVYAKIKTLSEGE